MGLNSNIYTGEIPEEGIYGVNPNSLITQEIDTNLKPLEQTFIKKLKEEEGIEIKSLDDLIKSK